MVFIGIGFQACKVIVWFLVFSFFSYVLYNFLFRYALTDVGKYIELRY